MTADRKPEDEDLVLQLVWQVHGMAIGAVQFPKDGVRLFPIRVILRPGDHVRFVCYPSLSRLQWVASKSVPR